MAENCYFSYIMGQNRVKHSQIIYKFVVAAKTNTLESFACTNDNKVCTKTPKDLVHIGQIGKTFIFLT